MSDPAANGTVANARCIRRDDAKAVEFEGETWCGRVVKPGEWAFIDLDHAAMSGARGGRTMTACPACVDKAVEALRHGR